MARKNKKRTNTHFRQSAKEFKAARQTQVYSHINRNLPYRIFKISKPQFLNKIKKLNIIKRKTTSVPKKYLSKTKNNIR